MRYFSFNWTAFCSIALILSGVSSQAEIGRKFPFRDWISGVEKASVASSFVSLDHPVYGVYYLRGLVTKRPYHLYISDSYSTYGQTAFMTRFDRTATLDPSVFRLWSGKWEGPVLAKEKIEGVSRNEVSSLGIYFLNRNAIAATVISTDSEFSLSQTGYLVPFFPLQGIPIPEEQHLRDQTGKSSFQAKSNGVLPFEGLYEMGAINGDHFELMLRKDEDRWMGSWRTKAGTFNRMEVTFKGEVDEMNVLRLVRPPDAGKLDTLAGISLVAVCTKNCAKTNMDEHEFSVEGYYFSPREDLIIPLKMQQRMKISD